MDDLVRPQTCNRRMQQGSFQTVGSVTMLQLRMEAKKWGTDTFCALQAPYRHRHILCFAGTIQALQTHQQHGPRIHAEIANVTAWYAECMQYQWMRYTVVSPLALVLVKSVCWKTALKWGLCTSVLYHLVTLGKSLRNSGSNTCRCKGCMALHTRSALAVDAEHCQPQLDKF